MKTSYNLYTIWKILKISNNNSSPLRSLAPGMILSCSLSLTSSF